MPGVTQGSRSPREIILRAVWPDTFVSDDVLTRSVSELRRALDDDSRSPRFIETIPKRGYRLVAAVTPIHEGLHAHSPSLAACVLLIREHNDGYSWRPASHFRAGKESTVMFHSLDEQIESTVGSRPK